MSVLLRAELLKLRTTRTFFALVGAALALSIALVVLGGLLGDFRTRADVRLIFVGDFTGAFIALLGAMGMAGEWRHRTITSTILAAPDRVRLLVAKTLSYAVAGVVVSFVITVSLMLIGTFILRARGLMTLPASDLLDVLWRNLLVAGLIGAIGVCVGAIVRSQIAAVIGLLVWMLFVESSLFVFAPDVAKFGPLNGAPSGIVDAMIDGGSHHDLLDPAIAVAVMVGWVALLFAIGAILLRRRDLT
ncbi:MAG: type transport system permease protein [Solirubrobacteraceae bacterium]|jgi:ABC-type transport system involved in multi-copper enzyme maturation permease subunit|nr:type transport system permease protein [Solirubrobacteraceae bacterium]